jgi:hypothetical protein
MPRGIAWVWWVATLLARVTRWPERWRSTGATALRALVEQSTEENPPRLIVTIEALEEGIGLLQRRVLVEGSTQHVGTIPWPHVRTARRTARGPPLVPRSVVDEVPDRESPDRKEKTC